VETWKAYHGAQRSYTWATRAGQPPVQCTPPGANPTTGGRTQLPDGRSWTDHLQEALIETHGEEQGLVLLRRYANAFPLSYRERFPAQAAVLDIQHAEAVLAQRQIGINLYRPIESPAHELRLKLYVAGQALTLSDVLPTLEHMGLKVLTEIPFRLRPGDSGDSIWVHDFRMETADGSEIGISEVKNVFHDAYAKIVAGEMEDDGFNRLVLLAHLDWREISVLRAYAKYLRQAGIAFSQIYMEEALAHNARLARRLVRLFRALFNPAKQATAAERARINEQEILKGLDAVTNLDEDRILRRFLNLIQSTLRTNFFQRGKDYISLKLDSHALEELPLPRPLVEIWICSPRVGRCICAAARWPGAASAGPTGARISAPRC
jgi:glutamate dehydrogenase